MNYTEAAISGKHSFSKKLSKSRFQKLCIVSKILEKISLNSSLKYELPSVI